MIVLVDQRGRIDRLYSPHIGDVYRRSYVQPISALPSTFQETFQEFFFKGVTAAEQRIYCADRVELVADRRTFVISCPSIRQDNKQLVLSLLSAAQRQRDAQFDDAEIYVLLDQAVTSRERTSTFAIEYLLTTLYAKLDESIVQSNRVFDYFAAAA